MLSEPTTVDWPGDYVPLLIIRAWIRSTIEPAHSVGVHSPVVSLGGLSKGCSHVPPHAPCIWGYLQQPHAFLHLLRASFPRCTTCFYLFTIDLDFPLSRHIVITNSPSASVTTVNRSPPRHIHLSSNGASRGVFPEQERLGDWVVSRWMDICGHFSCGVVVMGGMTETFGIGR